MSDLQHHGILGQRWGVRRFQNEDGSLTDHGKARIQKVADKDAKRFAEAKMFYGKTAGTKRKLLNVELDKKKKDLVGYEEAYQEALKKVDYAKAAEKAVSKRHTIDTTYRTKQTVKTVLGVTGPLTVAAGAYIYQKNKPAVDAFVVSTVKKIFKRG